MRLEEGFKDGETKEDGKLRRSEAERRRTLLFVRAIREEEEKRRREAMKLVKAALPDYDEIPL